MIEIGAHIPEFEVPATLRGRVGLKGLLGKPFVIYFYPKDATPGCTTETKDFMGLYPEFQKEGVEVLGFNHNPMKAHEKWSQKLQIPFPLLSDEGLEVIKAFGVWQKKKFMGREFMGIVRTTYIIGPEGKVVKRYDKVKVKNHAQEVLEEIIGRKN